MKTFAAVALVAAVSAIDTATFEFMQYISKYGKSYDTIEEFNTRMALFQKTNTFVKEWNSQPNQTSTVGHNFISDMTEEEKKGLRGLLEDGTERVEAPLHQVLPGDTYDNTIDWCTTTNPKGVSKCTPIKNQGQCGGCYAFSATETVESVIAIDNNTTPVAYSPQQIISCSSAYGNAGCNGGWYYYAWNYLQTNPQETEANYPYSNGSLNFGITGTCTYNKSLGVAQTASPTDYYKVGTTVADIQSAVNGRPVSIAIDASQSVFQQYTGGVITDAAACGTTLDHAVVAVGYGTDTTTNVPYFVVRNSWGTSWGLSGFVYLEATAAPGMCGMNQKVYYPVASLV